MCIRLPNRQLVHQIAAGIAQRRLARAGEDQPSVYPVIDAPIVDTVPAFKFKRRRKNVVFKAKGQFETVRQQNPEREFVYCYAPTASDGSTHLMGSYVWSPKNRKIYSLHVSQDWRGQGLARHLLDHACLTYGVPLQLNPAPYVERAGDQPGLNLASLIEFYRRYGFQNKVAATTGVVFLNTMILKTLPEHLRD